MRYASFVVRLWQPETEADTPDRALHGRIEHVQSGRIVSVTCLEDITEFVREQLLAVLSSDEREPGGAEDQS